MNESPCKAALNLKQHQDDYQTIEKLSFGSNLYLFDGNVSFDFLGTTGV